MPTDAATEELPSRTYVVLFSWFGLFLGFLRTIGGQALGFALIALSCIGLYATWSETRSRGTAVACFASGWAVWALFETMWLVCLLIASSDSASAKFASFIASSTFPNVSASIQSLLDALREDVTGFGIFSVFTSAVFDCLAFFWGLSLWKDIRAANAMVDASTLPLLQRVQATRPASAPNRGGFGTFGRPFPEPQPKRPKQSPFQGRGHRLGGE